MATGHAKVGRCQIKITPHLERGAGCFVYGHGAWSLSLASSLIPLPQKPSLCRCRLADAWRSSDTGERRGEPRGSMIPSVDGRAAPVVDRLPGTFAAQRPPAACKAQIRHSPKNHVASSPPACRAGIPSLHGSPATALGDHRIENQVVRSHPNPPSRDHHRSGARKLAQWRCLQPVAQSSHSVWHHLHTQGWLQHLAGAQTPPQTKTNCARRGLSSRHCPSGNDSASTRRAYRASAPRATRLPVRPMLCCFDNLLRLELRCRMTRLKRSNLVFQFTLGVAILALSQCVKDEPPQTSGYSNVTDTGEVSKAATFAVAQQAATSGEKMHLSRIVQAEQLRVGGTNHRIVLEVRTGGQKRLAQAVVYQSLAPQMMLMSWQWMDDNTEASATR